MNKDLFISFEGRINRKPYWIGMLVLLAITIAVSIVIMPIALGTNMLLRGLLFVLSFIWLWPLGALMVKRRHDRGKGAGLLIPAFLGLAQLSNFFRTFEIGYVTTEIGGILVSLPGTWTYALSAIVALISLWLLVELGFLKGTPGDNAYGPDPLGAAQ